MTSVEWFIEQLEEKGSASENVSIRRLQISIDVSEYLDLKRKAKAMEKEQKEKLWTNEEVFDMLYKTDKFLMIDLREYWKTIEK